MDAVLVVVGGLPATGKSTVASLLASKMATPYFRVDRIEQAIVDWSSLAHPIGPAGYAVAQALALEQLQLGLDVIVECVNPDAVTRNAWVSTAAAAGAVVVEVELTCSDAAEHRRRVEGRRSDVEGLVKPGWSSIMARPYEPWTREHLVLDTTKITAWYGAEQIALVVAAAKAESTDQPSGFQ